MSYRVLKDWADNHKPLSHVEEQALSKEHSGPQLLDKLIKHNARLIIKEVNRWEATYNLDDATQVVLLALTKAFKNWTPDKRFGYWARLRVKAALHRYKPRDRREVDIERLNIPDPRVRPYSDLKDLLQERMEHVFTEKEMEFVIDVYYLGLSVGEAGDTYGYKVRPSAYRKHTELLTRLRREVGEDLVDYL